MANPLPPPVSIGTIGELLVQLRMLEFGVQAAPPLKDSGNDLIAIRGRVVKFIQIKTSVNRTPSARRLPNEYDYVFLVNLQKTEGSILLDESRIFVMDRQGEEKGELNQHLTEELWQQN